MRVAVIGSRAFDDADLIERCVQRLVERHGDELVIVSRGMRGTGRLLEAAATKLGKPVALYPVNWDETDAGKDHNRALVAGVDQLVVIWDSKSDNSGRDVLHATKVALERQKPIFLYDVQGKIWITERADQWRITNVPFPLIPWYLRRGHH